MTGTPRRELIVVSPTFHPEPFGTPHYVSDMVQWFADQGWHVQVVTAQPFYPQFERYPGYGRSTRRDWFGAVPVFRLPTVVPRGGGALRRAVTDANFLGQGLVRGRFFGLPRASHVISVSPGSPVAQLVGAGLTRPGGAHVAVVHDVQSGLAAGLNMVRRRLVHNALEVAERVSLGRADRVFALSPEMADTLRSMRVAAPVDVLPLWATIEPGPRPAVQTDLQYSGSFGRKQGIEQLVELMVRLHAVRQATTFTVRGAGPMDSWFQEAVVEHAVPVALEGPVDADALAHALAMSRVHVVPQLAETASHVVPSKVINSLASGAGIVAFCPEDSPVGRMAVECRAIRIVAPGDIDGGVAAVTELLDANELDALRSEAIGYVRRHHDRDTLLKVLENALTGSASTNPT